MTDVERRQLDAEIAHWRLAIESLADLRSVASAAGWRSMESYLQERVKIRMLEMTSQLIAEIGAVDRLHATGRPPAVVRTQLLTVRRRYLQAETILDFWGDAINSRTDPELGALLRGYDALAADSIATTLRPLGIEAPPALVYIDKGLGAAVLRAGVRLWDRGHPSPAAAIKLTRHSLSHPTALFHETGHQAFHQAGAHAELAAALHRELAPRSTALAQAWSSWASEIAADVHAFAQTGWAPVSALANVVDGDTRAVFRIRFGDPHPFPWVRVMFNVALCRSWFGSGPWDDLGSTWARRHPAKGTGEAGVLAASSVDQIDAIVDVCTRRPMKAFGGRPLCAVLDPRRVSPNALGALERQAGPSLLTSDHLRRREPLRILGLLAARSITDPSQAAQHRAALRTWVTGVGHHVPGVTPTTGTNAA